MAVRPQSDVPREHVHNAHQPDQTSVKKLTIGVILLLLSLGGIQLFILWLVDAFAGGRATTPHAPRAVRDPSVLHWSEPGVDLHDLRKRDEVRLHTQEWLDQDKSFARIPIDEAMAILAQNGRSPYPAPSGSATETETARDEGSTP